MNDMMNDCWCVQTTYELRHDLAPDNREIADHFFEMTTAEAVMFDKFTDRLPFTVTQTDIDGNVIEIKNHAGKTIDCATFGEWGWTVSYIFPADGVNFFKAVESRVFDNGTLIKDGVKCHDLVYRSGTPIDIKDVAKIVNAEDKPEEPKKKRGRPAKKDFFDLVSGVWEVRLIPRPVVSQYVESDFIDLDMSDREAVLRTLSEQRDKIFEAMETQRKNFELKATALQGIIDSLK